MKLKIITLSLSLFMFCFIINAQSVKRVLVESFTSADNGQAPDGIAERFELMKEYGDDVVFINYHINDEISLYTFEGNELYSTYSGSIPTALIDRTEFNGDVALDVSDWDARIQERLNESPLVDITFDDITTSSNGYEIDLTVKFLEEVSGDLRISCAIIENYVSGIGEYYDQQNDFNNVSGHAFYQLGDPITGFNHQYVLRYFLSSGLWGDNLDFSMTTFPKDWEESYSYSGQIYQDVNVDQFYVVAFVRYHDDDISKRSVINVAQKKVTTVSMEEIDHIASVSEVFPNPVSEYGKIDISMLTENDVNIEIINTTGQVVHHESFSDLAPGDHQYVFDASDLATGSYIARINIGDHYLTKKFIK